jgi:hypothetical protein
MPTARVAVRPFSVAGSAYLQSASRFGFAARLAWELQRCKGLEVVPFELTRQYGDPRIEDAEIGRELAGPYVVAGQAIGIDADGHFTQTVRITCGLTGARLPSPPSIVDHVTSIDQLYYFQYPRLAAGIVQAVNRHREQTLIGPRPRLSAAQIVARAERVLQQLEVGAFDEVEAELRALLEEERSNAVAWSWLGRLLHLRLGQ